MPQPYHIFTIYAREDAQYLEELRGQLRPLENAGRIKVWSDREINPGAEWAKEIVQRLDTSDIILILVSSAYYNSAYIHDVEIKYALDRHDRCEARVLPIIVRPCSFEDDPIISRLQVLPTDGHAVTDRRHWPERDHAWVDVVTGVKRTLTVLQHAERERVEAAEAALAAERQRQEEALAAEQEAERQRQAEADTAAARQLQEENLQRQQQQEAEKQRLEKAERAEAERQEAAQRERKAQARRDREKAAAAEKGRLKEADLAAWRQAAEANDLPDYAHYLAQHPQGEYAQEARAHMKELKRMVVMPLRWWRYAVGGGLVLALLVIWAAFYHKPTDDTASKSTNGRDSIGVISSRPDSTARQPDSTVIQGSKTLSLSALPPNVTVGKAQEEKQRVSFDYPMVLVVGGSFTMGSPTSEDGRDDDECQHLATLRTFYMGKYEVTQAQWKAITGKNPSSHKNCDDCPVENVSWNEVKAFIKKLNAATGNNYRLPSEAEWEYAARGGANGQGYLYAGGNNLYELGSNPNVDLGSTQPVGGKKANELGLYDMSGSVEEWCQDIYQPYPCDGTTKPDKTGRVLRGGSWASSFDRRCADRSYHSSDMHDNRYGFRLAHD